MAMNRWFDVQIALSVNMVYELWNVDLSLKRIVCHVRPPKTKVKPDMDSIGFGIVHDVMNVKWKSRLTSKLSYTNMLQLIFNDFVHIIAFVRAYGLLFLCQVWPLISIFGSILSRIFGSFDLDQKFFVNTDFQVWIKWAEFSAQVDPNL